MVIKDCILATDVKYHGVQVLQLQNMLNVFKQTIDEEMIDNFEHIQLQKCESSMAYASIECIKSDGFALFADAERENEFNSNGNGDVIVRDLNLNDDEKEDTMLRQPRIDGVVDERLFILGITIHTCDVANPCKPRNLCIKWAERYLSEAFNQGDSEKALGIPVSMGMDRDSVKLPNSQIGFITFIVKRLYELYTELIGSDEAKICLD